MSASDEFKSLFTKKNLKRIYEKNIKYYGSVGIDGIKTGGFEKRLDENLSIIVKKAINGKYSFSEYRERLILRGNTKLPRTISIPTIRDKLTLKALQVLLISVFKSETPSLHNIVNEVNLISAKNEFTGIIRLDVKDYYPNINHELLLKQVSRKIRKKEILSIIKSAISRKTVKRGSGKNKSENSIGLPQGLPISNILANIYMSPIDNKYKTKQNLKYFRYVDDILIFCDQNKLNDIKNEIVLDCQKLGLQLHDDISSDKNFSGSINSCYDYLGYSFKGTLISVRDQSIENFRKSIIRSLTYYKYSSNVDIMTLIWTINLRITGCIFDNKKYGWLFYFSQINDLTLLSSLDHFISKKIADFHVSSNQYQLKKMIRAYLEIRNNLTNTNYIENFDHYDQTKKKQVLQSIYKVNINNKNAKEIEYLFRKNIFKSIKDIERDLSRPS